MTSPGSKVKASTGQYFPEPDQTGKSKRPIARFLGKTAQITESTEMFYENIPGKLLVFGMIGLTGNHRVRDSTPRPGTIFSHLSLPSR
jgi:hypothetical protein